MKKNTFKIKTLDGRFYISNTYGYYLVKGEDGAEISHICTMGWFSTRREAQEFLNKILGKEIIPKFSKQDEINRLRKVLHGIADSRPDQFMDVDKNPELVKWICETCRNASVGAYPQG